MKKILLFTLVSVVAVTLFSAGEARAEHKKKKGRVSVQISFGNTRCDDYVAPRWTDDDCCEPEPCYQPVRQCNVRERVWVPGHYETQMKEVVVPAHFETVYVPPQYTTVWDCCKRAYVQIKVCDGYYKEVYVPERVECREFEVYVPGHYEYR